jgi:Domain of unknown function (DUF1844)
MSAGEDRPKGFVVSDRRSFTTEGDKHDEEAAGKGDAPAAAAPGPGGERLPPVDFSTFVLSLGSSALMHLGEIEHPSTGTASKNLPMAKHSIDLLSMLEAKTKGNLDPGEAELLENLLYDLRLRYVTAAKSQPK